MLYMVEMELPDRARLDEWHGWYNGHIGKLLSVDGYDGGQRFQAVGECDSPFLAIHDVSGPDLFESEQYKSVGGPSGTGEWRTLMSNWHRNLFDGMDALPAVGEGQLLLLAADGAALPSALAERVRWVESIGLDRTIPRRGVLIVDEGAAATFRSAHSVTLYKPITPKFT